MSDPGVVDQNVDRAGGGLEGRDGVSDRVVVGDVGLVSDGLTIARGDRIRCLAGRRAVAVQHADKRPFLAESLADRAPDAGAAACHQGIFSRKATHRQNPLFPVMQLGTVSYAGAGEAAQMGACGRVISPRAARRRPGPRRSGGRRIRTGSALDCPAICR